jgi:hypothetical protein
MAAESQTGSYYSARETRRSGSGMLWRSPTTRSEDRSYSPGFNPTHWGRDPSDPFYHHGEW